MATKKETKSNEFLLKARVKELEEEVSLLKRKLEDLRKAKHTTVHKREREIVQVGTPFSRRESTRRASETKDDKHETDWEKEISDLREKFAKEMEEMKSQMSNNGACAHEEEIQKLQDEMKDLKNENMALRMQNGELEEQVDALRHELSVKEASWCENEEKMKTEIKHSWQEQYREWMEKTEAKIEELQNTNALLRGYLKNQKPSATDKNG